MNSDLLFAIQLFKSKQWALYCCIEVEEYIKSKKCENNFNCVNVKFWKFIRLLTVKFNYFVIFEQSLAIYD